MHLFLSLVGAAVLATGTCLAAEPDHELAPQTAVKLINLLIEDREQQIEIAMIVEGKSQQGPFQAEHVRRVVTVHPVQEEGKRVRRMRCYDFQWSPAYGWFTWEKRVERGGDAIWIWSELKGEVVVR
jgi:hypothetical protein